MLNKQNNNYLNTLLVSGHYVLCCFQSLASSSCVSFGILYSFLGSANLNLQSSVIIF